MFDFWVGTARCEIPHFKTDLLTVRAKVVALRLLNETGAIWEIELRGHQLPWSIQLLRGVYSPRTRNGHFLIEGIEQKDIDLLLSKSGWGNVSVKIDAVQRLLQLRSEEPPWEYDRVLHQVELVIYAGLTLAEVGTSEEELQELRLRGSRYKIHSCLERARNGDEPGIDFLVGIVIPEEMRESNFSPEEVGTTAEELEGFAQKYPYKPNTPATAPKD